MGRGWEGEGQEMGGGGGGGGSVYRDRKKKLEEKLDFMYIGWNPYCVLVATV